MNMKVAIPAQSLDVDFNSARSSPFSSCSSTATRPSGFFFSAPTSPVRFTELYREFDELQTASSIAPYDSEATAVEDDFAFDFSADLERSSLSAEELFDGGKIKPLTPQLGLSNEDESEKSATVKIPNSPILSLLRGKKTIRSGLSSKQTKSGDERGRNRVSARSNSASSRGATRSVSPLRVSEYPWEEKDEDEKVQQQNSKRSQSLTAAKPSSSSWRSYRKWKLKDFFLFRSASEGRGSDKDPLKKYAGLSRKREEDIKNSSFRSISAESSGSVSSARRRGQQVSAHELHYTVNRAVSEDLKKKTFLPYKQGILGRLAFNPSLHALANGFGFFTRS